MNRAHSYFFGPIATPPERHQVQIDWRGETPYARVRMGRQSLHASRFNQKSFHLHAFALRIAGKRANVMHQVPSVLSIRPIAHRHWTSGNTGNNMAVERDRVRAPFEDAGGEIPRTNRITLGIGLFLRTVAASGGPMAGSTSLFV